MATATVKLHICVFLSVAVADTEWVHNSFTNDAMAISHHMNSLMCLH